MGYLDFAARFNSFMRKMSRKPVADLISVKCHCTLHSYGTSGFRIKGFVVLPVFKIKVIKLQRTLYKRHVIKNKDDSLNTVV